MPAPESTVAQPPNTLSEMIDQLRRDKLATQSAAAKSNTSSTAKKAQIATLDQLTDTFGKAAPNLKSKRADGNVACRSGNTDREELDKKLTADFKVVYERVKAAVAWADERISEADARVKSLQAAKTDLGYKQKRQDIVVQEKLESLNSVRDELANLPKTIGDSITAIMGFQKQAHVALDANANPVDGAIAVADLTSELARLKVYIDPQTEKDLIAKITKDLPAAGNNDTNYLEEYIAAVDMLNQILGDLDANKIALDDATKSLDEWRKNRTDKIKAYYQERIPEETTAKETTAETPADVSSLYPSGDKAK